MNQIEVIDQEIADLENQLSQVKGKTTEVYTRIVGYYRSVKNWNAGKRDEFGHRKTFSKLESKKKSSVSVMKKVIDTKKSEKIDESKVASFNYYYRNTCPNCPPVKDLVEKVPFQGNYLDVDNSEGFKRAAKEAIFATPTAIFFDESGKELFRGSNVDAIKSNLSNFGLNIEQL